MSDSVRNTIYFAGVALLIIITGFVQSWNTALFILNFGLISDHGSGCEPAMGFCWPI